MRPGIPLKCEIVYKKNTSQSCITYSYKYAHPIKHMFMIIYITVVKLINIYELSILL